MEPWGKSLVCDYIYYFIYGDDIMGVCILLFSQKVVSDSLGPHGL